MLKNSRGVPVVCGAVSFVISFMLVHASLTHAAIQNTAELLFGADHSSAATNSFVNVGIGMDSGTQKVTGIDAVLTYDSSILELTGAVLGSTSLKSLVPGNNNVLDLTKAVTINQTDPKQSTISLGLAAFDQATNQLTASISGRLDPLANPLVTLNFKTLKSGQAVITPLFSSGGTTESNIISLDSGDPADIMAAPSGGLTINVTDPSPTPTPRPTPTPTPSATPTPTPSATPAPSASPPQCVSYDFNSDHLIDIRDLMLSANRWNSRLGDPLYDPKFDLNHNNWIDIADIQIVANAWGTSCP